MGTRAQLAARLDGVLGADFTIIDHPSSIDSPANSIRAVVVIVRVEVAHGPTRAALAETFRLWVIDPDENSEDTLDESLDDILIILDNTKWLDWDKARRDVFQDQYPAYAIDITVHSLKE